MKQQSISFYSKPKLTIKDGAKKALAAKGKRTYGSSSGSKRRAMSSVSPKHVPPLVAPKTSYKSRLRDKKQRKYSEQGDGADDGDSTCTTTPCGGRAEQIHLDFGQTQFTECAECLMRYEVALDAALHASYHQEYLHGIQWSAGAQQCTRLYSNDAFSVVRPCKTSYKVLQQLRAMVDQQLGSSEAPAEAEEDAFTLVALAGGRCVGYLCASRRAQAFRLSTAGDHVTCSKEPLPVTCGIDKIWVIKSMRRRSIATRMIDTLLNHFVYGVVLNRDQVAFSEPTQFGRLLASTYYGTSSFLVY